MKKIIVIIVFLVSMILPINILAYENDSIIDWELDRNIFVHRVINGEYHLNNMPFLTVNGNVVYCIEPGAELQKGGVMSSSYNYSDTNLNKELIMSPLYGYYGYKKFGHDDPMYYLATQKLIWLETGASSVKFTYDREGNNVIDTSYYESEILKMVNNYGKYPQFNFESKYLVGDEVTLEDINNVLNDYEIHTSNGNVIINGNTLNIKIEENNNFSLRRKSDNTKTVYYYKPGMQTVASFGFPREIIKNYRVVSEYGKVTLNKVDSNNGESKPYNDSVFLSDALYGIYDETDKLISENITDENGMLIFDNLPKGKYIIKEIKPSIGYTLNNEDILINIDKNNLSLFVKAKEKIITGEVKIRKILNNINRGVNELEENILFGVYDLNGNLVVQGKTNDIGELSFKLPYGNYVIKQLTAPLGVIKVDDFNLSIKNDGEVLEYTLINELEPKIDALPKTGKNINILIIAIMTLLILYKHEKNNT